MDCVFRIVDKPEYDWEFEDGFDPAKARFVPAKAYNGKLYRGFLRNFIPYSRWIKGDREIEKHVHIWHGAEVFKEGATSIEQLERFMDPVHEEFCFACEYSSDQENRIFGMDVIAPIDGSLIVTWLERFGGDIEGLNDNLLFDDPQLARRFIEAYLAEAEMDRIEPPNTASDPTLILIGPSRFE